MRAVRPEPHLFEVIGGPLEGAVRERRRHAHPAQARAAPVPSVVFALVVALAAAALGCDGLLAGNTVTGTVSDALESRPAAGVAVRLYALAPGAAARILGGCRRQDSVERRLVAHQSDIFPKTLNASSARERTRWRQLWDSDNANRDIGWRNLEAEITAATGAQVASDRTGPDGRYRLRGVPAGEYIIEAMGSREVIAVPSPDEVPLAFVDRSRIAELRTPSLRAFRPDVCPAP